MKNSIRLDQGYIDILYWHRYSIIIIYIDILRTRYCMRLHNIPVGLFSIYTCTLNTAMFVYLLLRALCRFSIARFNWFLCNNLIDCFVLYSYWFSKRLFVALLHVYSSESGGRILNVLETKYEIWTSLQTRLYPKGWNDYTLSAK